MVLGASIGAPGSHNYALSSTPRHRVKSTSLLQEPVTLLPGLPVSRTLNGGETHTFRISIPSGQYSALRVRHRGIILVASLLDKAGKEIVANNDPAGGYGQIFLSMIGEDFGEYFLRLRSTESWANPGSYELAIVETRSATTADEERISAERTFADGSKQYEKEDRAAYLEAQHSYEIALEKWDKLRDDHWRALTRYILGATHARLGDRPEAEQYFLKSLEIDVDENDWRLRATTLNDLGFTDAILGKKEAALDYLNQALSSYQAHDDRRGQASALNNKAYTYARAGEMETARLLYEQALAYRQIEHDKNGEIYIINNLGGIYDRLGEPYSALANFAKALEGYRELKQQGLLRDERRLGQAFNNVAVANDKLNRWPQAFENYDQALTIFEAIGDAGSQAVTLDNIGELHAALGDPDRALGYYQDALSLIEKVKDPDAAANILTHMGQAHISQGKLQEALSDFQSALKLTPSPSKSKLANIYSNLGSVYAQQRKANDALSSYEAGLTRWRDIADKRGEAATLLKRGESFLAVGDQKRAAEDFNAALNIWRSLSDQRGEASALNGFAATEIKSEHWDNALKNSNEAVAISEALRTNISSQRLRASYFATQQGYYELNIDLRMRLYRSGNSEYLKSAFETSERSRARSLLDALGENHLDISHGVSADLLRGKSELERRLEAKELVQARLLNGTTNREQLDAIKKEIATLVAASDDVDARIRASSPLYANLIRPKPLSTQEIQQQLHSETMLLEYSLGDRCSYVWAVTTNSIDGFPLPPRDDIEKPAKRIAKSLADRKRTVEGETDAQWERRREQADKEFNTASAELSDKIIRPLASILGTKRLIVVADGALQLVSFAALPLHGNTAEKQRRLIDDHEIVYEPSASVLALQRTELADRKRAPHAVAILADPVFASDDSRVAALNERKPPTNPPKSSGNALPPNAARRGDVSRALEDIGLGRFPRLRSSAIEAQRIVVVAPKGESKAARDFDASRETAMSRELSEYRIVHFATHAVVDYEHPELSGIVLSLVDRKGQPQDGYLRLHDIYNLNLPVDLIVLSACQTGVGKEIKGEGLIALTRGFMYAGAERVVASLWKVDDAATAELMAQFYKQMFVSGQRPAAALRAAQITLAKKRSPADWAGFVLQGEWK
jgi:CHAT domain-containing protein/Flp pilus assembly protein TadD